MSMGSLIGDLIHLYVTRHSGGYTGNISNAIEAKEAEIDILYHGDPKDNPPWAEIRSYLLSPRKEETKCQTSTNR